MFGKRKGGFISAVKRFYDKSKLAKIVRMRFL